MNKGIVQVQIAFDQDDLKQAGIPVEVRRLSMVVAERGSTGKPIAIEPGTYLVTATLPGGEELVQRVEVGVGETKTVNLTPPTVGEVTELPFSPRYTTQQYFAVSAPPLRSTFLAGADGVREEDREDSQAVSAAASFMALATPLRKDRLTDRTVSLRLLSGNPFAPPLDTIGGLRIVFTGTSSLTLPQAPIGEPLNKLPLLTADEGLPGSNDKTERWVSSDTYQLVLTMPAPATIGSQTFWLRITSPPDHTRFVAVPALPSEQCVLLLTRSGTRRALIVDFHLMDSEMDILLHYHQHGNAPEAMAMLLRDEIQRRVVDSPLYRALVGYIALRLGGGALDELTKTLLDFRDWDLPDARAIRGELLARRGHHEEAQDLLIRSVEGGLPIFSDGLGYLSSRIPQYLRLMSSKGEALSQTWDRLRSFLRVADLKPVILTLRGNVLGYKDRA